MFGFLKKRKAAAPAETKPVRRVRRFAAAGTDRLLEWATSYNKIDGDLKLAYDKLVTRARDLAKNNQFVVGILKNLQRNVIGADGFTLQSRSEDADRRAGVERLWREYQSRIGGYVTFDERQSGRDFDALVLRTLLVDGEVFIHRAYDPESRFGYRYEVVDSLEIDPFYNVADIGNGEKIVMGVKLDDRGRETAYYICEATNDQYRTGPRVEVPAADMIHIYRKEFADQTRGITPLASVILDLAQLDAYKEAEVVHARIQACSMAIWEQNGQATGDLLDDVDDKGEFIREMKPGIFPVAPKGYTAKQLSNNSPNNQYGVFWKSMLRGIANSLGVSYNKAAGDYESVNYSSLREATLEDRSTFEDLQRFFIENWKDFEFRDFVRGLVERGELPAGEMADGLRHRFFGRRFPWVDPAKEIAAKREEFDLLLTDPISELEARGLDPEEVLDRCAEWKKMVLDRGLEFMAGDKPTAPAETADDEEENNNPEETDNGSQS